MSRAFTRARAGRRTIRRRADSPCDTHALPATRGDRGVSLLETVAAIGVTALVLGGAADRARSACAVIREARVITNALTSARNVLDLALATPCASVQSASALCDPALHCTISAGEAGRRTTASGTVVLVRITVEVTRASEALVETKLARLVGMAARPETCS